LDQYEREFLPLNSSREHEDDEGYAGSDDSRQGTGNEQRKQDIHALVARVRHDLVSWRLRQDSAEWLKEELGLSKPSDKSKNTGRAAEDDDDNPDTSMQDPEDHDYDSENEEDDEPMGKFNVSSLTLLDTSARQLRIIWADDRVGRLKISDTGKIEKAVVIGEDGNRVRDVERILMGDQEAAGLDVTELLAQLEIVYTKSMAVEEEPDAPT
jgi:central kinetochore subunit Mal2/MCM21